MRGVLALLLVECLMACGAAAPVAGPEAGLSPPVAGALECSRGFDPAGRHFGVDLPAPEGTPVLASAAGVVVRASAHRSYGLVAVVRHAREYTLYAHLRALAVGLGESVAAGSVLGEVGRTGNASGPHLHFEVLRGADLPLRADGPLGIAGDEFRVDPALHCYRSLRAAP